MDLIGRKSIFEGELKYEFQTFQLILVKNGFKQMEKNFSFWSISTNQYRQ